MANRSLAAKAERAKRQMREAALKEYTKPAWLSWRDGGGIGPSELAQMVQAFKGEIKRYPPGKYTPMPGKNGRVAATRCYGDGRRRKDPLIIGCMDLSSRLIRK